jgi:hypothetical protein
VILKHEDRYFLSPDLSIFDLSEDSTAAYSILAPRRKSKNEIAMSQILIRHYLSTGMELDQSEDTILITI